MSIWVENLHLYVLLCIIPTKRRQLEDRISSYYFPKLFLGEVIAIPCNTGTPPMELIKDKITHILVSIISKVLTFFLDICYLISCRSIIMGGKSSITASATIDVAGNNNYVVLINGVQFNFTTAFYELGKSIHRENQTMMLVTISSCVVITAVLAVVVIYILLRLHTEYRDKQSWFTIKSIENGIEHLQRSFQRIHFKPDCPSILLSCEQMDRRSHYVRVDHPLQSIDQKIPIHSV
jgi:hypothetical protein